MKPVSPIRTLLLFSGLIFLANGALPQTAPPGSVSWQDTVAWLVPAFNQTATLRRSLVCPDRVSRHEEKAQIVTITPTELIIRRVDSGEMGMFGLGTITAHLTLSTLNPNVIVDSHHPSGPVGNCHFEPDPWIGVAIEVTDSAKDAIDIAETSGHTNVLLVMFEDESMAHRCAAAISHLIRLAGGKAPKPAPF